MRHSREPTRRSSRKSQNEESSSRRDKSSSETPSAKSPRDRKRKRTPIEERSPSVPNPKIQKKTVEGRKIDAYCWICHKLGQDMICNNCPRVYHKDCMWKSHLKFNDFGCCEECQTQTLIKGVYPEKIHRQRIREVLKISMQEAVKEDAKKNSVKIQATTENPKFCKYFKTWPLDKSDMLCQIIDLDILIDKVNDDFPYQTCAAFFADVKWIYHNCYILYGVDSEITEAALKLEKNFKQELLDIEGCQECYLLKHSKDSDYFTKVCTTPHNIIWAKLRGSPYWPAKCLRLYNSHADVRFFGTHDKSVVPLNQCYHISQRSPNERENKQFKYQDAIAELSIYVSSYRKNFGDFLFYPVRTHLESRESKKSKRGRRRRTPLKNITIDSSQIENDLDAEESGKVFKCLEIQLKDHFKAVIQPNSTEFQSNDSNELNMASAEDPVAVCMSFEADEEMPPLNDPSRVLDSSPPHSLKDSVTVVSNASLLLDVNSNTPFVNSNLSNELPVITSAVSEDPGSCSRKKSNSFPNERDLEETPASALQKLANLVAMELHTSGRAVMSIPDDEVVVVGEKNVEPNAVKEIMQNSTMVYGLYKVISSNRPHLQNVYKKCLDFGLTSFIHMWLSTFVKKGDDTITLTFLKYCQTLLDENQGLRRDINVMKQKLRLAEEECQKWKKQVSNVTEQYEVAKSRQENAKKIINVINVKAGKNTNKNKDGIEGGLANIQELFSCIKELKAECANHVEKIDELKKQDTENLKIIANLQKQHKDDLKSILDLQKRLDSRHNNLTSTSSQTALADSMEKEASLQDLQMSCSKLPEKIEASSFYRIEGGRKITYTRITKERNVRLSLPTFSAGINADPDSMTSEGFDYSLTDPDNPPLGTISQHAKAKNTLPNKKL